ncbi:hypothetical protein [Pseudonocardia sp.]|nr:hypothetical protein [Pseudonocardia sp.]
MADTRPPSISTEVRESGIGDVLGPGDVLSGYPATRCGAWQCR